MKNLKFLPALMLAAGVPFVSTAAFAQPDPNNTPKIENPQNRAVRGNRNQFMDPAAMQQRLAQRAKQQLQAIGITDTAQQEAVLAYTDGEREAESTLREKGQQLQVQLRGKTVTDSQLATLLNDYQVAISEDKERRVKALETLKQTIDFTRNPRVETYLTLSGLYGDGPALLGAINLNQRGQRGGGGQLGGIQMGGQFGEAQGRPANNFNFNAGAGAGFNGGGVGGGAAVAPLAGANANGTNLNEGAPRNNRNRNRRNDNTPEAPAAALVPAN